MKVMNVHPQYRIIPVVWELSLAHCVVPVNGDDGIVTSGCLAATSMISLAVFQELTAKEVRFDLDHEHLSFTGQDAPMAKLLLSVMGAFAEFERALIRERQP